MVYLSPIVFIYYGHINIYPNNLDAIGDNENKPTFFNKLPINFNQKNFYGSKIIGNFAVYKLKQWYYEN